MFQFYGVLNKINKMNKVSLTTHQQIQKHCANNSPAKISYRFPTSQRFKDANPECPIAYYTFCSQLSNKKAPICSSKKSDFTKNTEETPAGTQYNPNSYYQFTKQKGLTFGTSREHSPAYLTPQIHFHPGPGKYQSQDIDKFPSNFTIKSKTIDVIQKHKSYKEAPGPGSYETINLLTNKEGLKVSKYKGAPLGAKVCSRRFKSLKTAPGPQTYKQIDSFSPNARYLVSSHRGRGTRPFTQQKRFTHNFWKHSDNPGPGNYQKPSDFGVYGDSKLFKGRSTII